MLALCSNVLMALAVCTATYISFVSDYNSKMEWLLEVDNRLLLSHPSLAFMFDSVIPPSVNYALGAASLID